jgi:hypothetical protein
VGEEARGLTAGRLDREGEQADRHLLPGGHHHVLLPLARPLVHHLDQLQQTVGLPGHRRDHDHQVVTRRPRLETPPCDRPDALRVRHRRAPVFLDPQRHRRPLLHAARAPPRPGGLAASARSRSGMRPLP